MSVDTLSRLLRDTGKLGSFTLLRRAAILSTSLVPGVPGKLETVYFRVGVLVVLLLRLLAE